MIVSHQELEAEHARARALALASGCGPRHGLFGPASAFWTINRESAVLLGGGAAVLLQLAHPYVAHAIDQHSRTRDDVLGRFRATFRHVLTMVFGTSDQACAAAHRVYAVHARIHGQITEDVGRFAAGHRYHANEPEALLWVHATLVATALDVYQAVVRPLGADERDAYYLSSKRFAYLFGIPDRVIPADYQAFRRYMDDTVASSTIAVCGPARDMARFLLSSPNRWQTPVWHLYRTITAGFLPERLRAPFGLSFDRARRIEFAWAIRALAASYRALPDSLRYFPEYLSARAGEPLDQPGADRAALQRLIRLLLAVR